MTAPHDDVTAAPEDGVTAAAAPEDDVTALPEDGVTTAPEDGVTAAPQDDIVTAAGDDLVQGDRVELTVGAPAHGGHCVARLDGPHGRVVFVRHALPGERVTAEITEVHKGFLRADAVTIHAASPERVEPPCVYAHPGGCGGCDLQHVSASFQRQWKEAVIGEQLRRLAKIDIPVRVEALPAAEPLLGWRSRVRYAVDAAGRAGLLQHRSHEVVPIERCVIAHPAIQELDVLGRTWSDADALQAVASTGGDVTVLARTAGSVSDDPTEVARGFATRLSGPGDVVEVAAGRSWRVPAGGFWQVHPAAADALVDAVLSLLSPVAGETAWDLYGGAGLFAAALAERTGARVTIVESSAGGVAAARANLTDLPVDVVSGRVETSLRGLPRADLVVLDPPRAGAGGRVVRGIVAAGPRAVAYVACDPAAFARDVGTFVGLGWSLAALRAFDCFPMTQHVECVGLLLPPAA